MPRRSYDDEEIVELLARGEMSYPEIATRLGISESLVGQISRGEKRPELQAHINARVQGHITEARRLGARWTKDLLAKHVKDGLAGDSETARRCREYALDQFLGPANKGADPQGQQEMLERHVSAMEHLTSPDAPSPAPLEPTPDVLPRHEEDEGGHNGD